MATTDLSVSGLASGFDWKSVVDQLVNVERSPQTTMRKEQATIQQKTDAYDIIQSQLSTLQTKMQALKDPTLFDSRSTASSNTAVGTAVATGSTPLGTYSFKINTLATSSILRSTGDMGGSLSVLTDGQGLALSSAPFSTPVTAGVFTVNGKQITVSTSDTLDQVFTNVSTATGGAVTGTYDPSTDKISFTNTSGGQVVLGSANDTSNFLSVARLSNNGTSTVTSSMKLGSVSLTAKLSAANLGTTITDGGAHAGQFKVNGVAINYDASVDSITDVLGRINNSTAGVSASYDPITDGFIFTNKVSGNLGLTVQDVTGNFLSAIGVSGGSSSFTLGSDLQYTVNGNATVLTSHSNTIDEVSSGIPGLSVSALTTGDVSITVGTDTSKIKKAVQDFVTEYNKSQSVIDTYTASTTDSKGNVTAGVLAADRDAFDLASKLRGLANGGSLGSSSVVRMLATFGIESNGNNNSLTAPDDAKLQAALSTNFSGVKDFFTNTTSGFGKTFNDFLESTVGINGSLPKKQTLMAQQISAIDDQVAAQERQVQNVKAQLTAGFQAMESAQAKFNQQLQFISQKFGIS